MSHVADLSHRLAEALRQKDRHTRNLDQALAVALPPTAGYGPGGRSKAAAAYGSTLRRVDAARKKLEGVQGPRREREKRPPRLRLAAAQKAAQRARAALDQAEQQAAELTVEWEDLIEKLIPYAPGSQAAGKREIVQAVTEAVQPDDRATVPLGRYEIRAARYSAHRRKTAVVDGAEPTAA
ncbi:hypothetical protein DBP12_03595 [Streptomyces sp. CS014]|nr:hypothetical protein DBP12_03595 [Streptomyces sp. CS014]